MSQSHSHLSVVYILQYTTHYDEAGWYEKSRRISTEWLPKPNTAMALASCRPMGFVHDDVSGNKRIACSHSTQQAQPVKANDVYVTSMKDAALNSNHSRHTYR